MGKSSKCLCERAVEDSVGSFRIFEVQTWQKVGRSYQRRGVIYSLTGGTLTCARRLVLVVSQFSTG